MLQGLTLALQGIAQLERRTDILLAINRLETDRQMLNVTSLRLAELAERAADFSSFEAQERQVSVVREVAEDLPIIYGDGLQSRDFTYVANVVAANLLACERDSATGQVMNVALGERITLLELVEDLNSILGTQLAPRFEAARPGDVKHSQADTSRVKAVLGFEQRVDFRSGLRETVQWFREASMK